MKKGLIVAYQILLFGYLSLQCASYSLAQRFSFVDEGRKSYTLPFDLVHNLVIIPVRINGSDTLRFILDSGVKTPILFGLPAGAELELNNARELTLEGYGNGMEVRAYASTNNQMSIKGEIETTFLEMYVLPSDILGLSQYMGMEIHGIIGYDLYASFVIKTNYSKKKITLYEHSQWSPPKRKWHHLPIQILRAKPYLRVMIEQDSLTDHDLNATLVMDTGASFAFALLEGEGRAVKLPDHAFPSFLGKGMTGPIYGKTGRVKGAEIGGRYRMEQPIVNYPDSISSYRILKDRRRDGNIGAEVFSRFHLIVSYFDSCIYLRPNKRYGQSFDYNYSGIEVITPVPGIKIYEVAYLDSTSSAWQAGLRSGDQIHLINGMLTSAMTLNDVINEITGRPGGRLKLVIFRDDKFIKVKLRVLDQTRPEIGRKRHSIFGCLKKE